MAKKPELMTTTLWDFPSQQYGDESQGDKEYRGATPAYIIWNLLQRYTKEKDLVIDPMAGSGTTLDVARDLGRRALGYDLQPTRPDIFHCDARKLPLQDEKASFVFIDPPYSTHLEYSDDPRCIGKLDAHEDAYYASMTKVIEEIHRILRPGRYMALYVSDSYQKGKNFCPIGFELFSIMRRYFEPIDIVCVTRRNRTLFRNHWHTAAAEGNFYLRGFNYLFIMRKAEKPSVKFRPSSEPSRAPQKETSSGKRMPEKRDAKAFDRKDRSERADRSERKDRRPEKPFSKYATPKKKPASHRSDKGRGGRNKPE